MSLTQWYVDPSRAGEGNVGAGTIGDPYSDLQYALDTITRDATNGDQINIKAGTAEVLSASLTLATYGTPTGTASLVIRGYTASANDGGMGEIDCDGNTMFAQTTYDYITLIDMKIHTFGDNNGVVLDQYSLVQNCEIYEGAPTVTGKTPLSLGNGSVAAGNYLHTLGISPSQALHLYGAAGVAIGNYIVAGQESGGFGFAVLRNGSGVGGRVIQGNIILLNHEGQTGLFLRAADIFAGNIVVNTAAGRGQGVRVYDGYVTIINNIICGFSGTGGVAVYLQNAVGLMLGHNALYNNATNYSLPGVPHSDLRARDALLSAGPFTDAENGDFSLTVAAKTALADKGWPTSYLGAHANTDPHITIGAIQQALATGGGFPKIASVLGRTRM